MDPSLIITSRYNCQGRFRWKHTPSDSQRIHPTQDDFIKSTVCLEMVSLWINCSSEIHKNSVLFFFPLLSNCYCQNFHKVLCELQDQSPACSACVFHTHTHVHTQNRIYKYINMKQIPLKCISTGEWALLLQICMQSLKDDEEWSETSRQKDSASYYLRIRHWRVH